MRLNAFHFDVASGRYCKYTNDLLALQECTPGRAIDGYQLGPVGGSGSPLFERLGQWQVKLKDHLDRSFVQFIMKEGLCRDSELASSMGSVHSSQ